MLFFKQIIENIIYIFFPLAIYLIYVAYRMNLKKEENKTVFNICLFTSMYLILRFNPSIDTPIVFALSNIPLLLSYIKKQGATSILLSVILIWYQNLCFGIPLSFALLEYVIYFAIYFFIQKERWKDTLIINTFLLVKAFFLGIQAVLFLQPGANTLTICCYVLAVMVIFFVVTYIIYYLLKKGEQIMDLNSTMKELEKEKKLRASLFKITHEIKNPISVCKGYLDMLDLKDPDKVNKYIPIIKNEISRTLTLMDDYLDYTKIKIVKEDTDLGMLIEDVTASLETILSKNKIDLELDMEDEEIYLDLDYNRIKQVLVNLVKNAKEALKPQRKMKIKIKVYTDENDVIVKVIDNGKGMSEEELKKVDEMFYTTKKDGTGLGVSLSKEIIELHGGTLKYDSTLGKGTTATIVLPMEAK